MNWQQKRNITHSWSFGESQNVIKFYFVRMVTYEHAFGDVEMPQGEHGNVHVRNMRMNCGNMGTMCVNLLINEYENIKLWQHSHPCWPSQQASHHTSLTHRNDDINLKFMQHYTLDRSKKWWYIFDYCETYIILACSLLTSYIHHTNSVCYKVHVKHLENHQKWCPRETKKAWSPWTSNPKAFSNGAKHLHGTCWCGPYYQPTN